MNEPLNCPCCNHKAKLMPYLGKHYVQCRAKDCHIRTEPYETAEQALNVWNRRVMNDGRHSPQAD